MSVTCYLSGRWGNCIFHIAHMIAYAKKYNLPYYVPTQAVAYNHFKNGDLSVPFVIKSTGAEPLNPKVYQEPHFSDGNPAYHEVPLFQNVLLDGYFQSFKYFDWCRDYILETFGFPYKMNEGVVSISVRRGDCVGSTAFPIAPPEYYHKSIAYMQERGYNSFLVHSDDNEWCRKEFTTENYAGAAFEFSDGTEMQDFCSIQNCEHQITARSTFSLTAAWFNRNPNKIVLVPQEKTWWRGQNKDLIPEYFKQIYFEEQDSDLHPHIYDFRGGTFKLIINSYWSKIANGKPREDLYHDYAVMLETVTLVDRGKYILDIGANCGIFAVPASLLGYKVFGFEPVKQNINSLELARIENGLKRFDMFHAALSDKAGEVEVYVPECYDNASLSKSAAISNMKGKEYSVEKVPAFVFDDWIKDHENFKDIGFIKIDTQGSEFNILSGMKESLINSKDVHLVVEFENHLTEMGHTFKELNDLIYSYGFRHISTTGNDRYYYK